MLSYDLAEVEDRGSYWAVFGITQGDPMENEKATYLTLSHVSHKIINDALINGKRVTIRKPLMADEVLPTEVNVSDIDPEDINEQRSAAIKRARMVVNQMLASNSAYVFYRYMCANNELCDRGYFITEGNREMKYLEILETGDEELISLLENYLNDKDQIHRAAYLHKDLEDLRIKIFQEESVEVINKMVDDFMTNFYSTY